MPAFDPVPTVVFDLGGVVLHWEPAQLLMQHLPERLATVEQARDLATRFFESFRPGGAWAEFDRGMLSVDDVGRRIANNTGLPIDAVHGVMQGVPAHLTLRADTTALLRELKGAGHRLVYLSNMPAPYVGHVGRLLDQLDVFERGVFSSQVRLIKPDPALFELALQTFGCQAADCVFLDDSLVNVDAAARAGWRVLHFKDAAQAQRELPGLGVLSDPGSAVVPFNKSPIRQRIGERRVPTAQGPAVSS